MVNVIDLLEKQFSLSLFLSQSHNIDIHIYKFYLSPYFNYARIIYATTVI